MKRILIYETLAPAKNSQQLLQKSRISKITDLTTEILRKVHKNIHLYIHLTYLTLWTNPAAVWSSITSNIVLERELG